MLTRDEFEKAVDDIMPPNVPFEALNDAAFTEENKAMMRLLHHDAEQRAQIKELRAAHIAELRDIRDYLASKKEELDIGRARIAELEKALCNGLENQRAYAHPRCPYCGNRLEDGCEPGCIMRKIEDTGDADNMG